MKKSSNRLLPAIPAVSVVFEEIEPRVYLNAAPTFATALYDAYVVPTNGNGGQTIGIDGADKDGDALTITATSDNPLLQVYVPANTQYATLHFVQPPASGTAAPTVIGDIVVQLFTVESPTAANHFITLATQHINSDGTIGTGDPFYTDVLVHRVIPNFMIQTGDAANGDGTGGSPLGAIADSFNSDLSFIGSGVLAMANSGANTSDAQFFITQAPYTYGNGSYMIFGQVISGMSVLNQIINVSRDTSTDRPYNPPVLSSVTIAASPQDGTVRLLASSGLTGVSHVTITLNDGHGHLTNKVITVRPSTEIPATRPTIAAVSEMHVVAGQTVTIPLSVTYGGTVPLLLSGLTDNGATISVDSATDVATITIPATFHGMMKAQVSAIESPGNWADTAAGTQIVVIFVDNLVGTPEVSHLTDSSSIAMASVSVGNYLYTAMGSSGLVIYDVTDSAHPTQVGSLAISGFATDVQVVGNTAYLTEAGYGLACVNVTDPAHPALLGTAAAQDISLQTVISGNTAWVADYRAGVTGYDITDPANPTKIATISQITTTFSLAAVYAVALKGNYLYICDAAGVIVIADVSTPASPVALTGFGQDLKTNIWDIAISGNTLFATAGDNTNGWKLAAYDITNPQHGVKLIGKTSILGCCRVHTAGNTAIVTGTTGYTFVNVSNPRKMIVEGTFGNASIDLNDLIYGGGAGVGSTWVSLPMGTDGLVLVDATKGVSNGSVSYVDGSGHTVKVTVSKGSARMYLSAAFSGNITTMDINGTALTAVTIAGQTTIGDVNVTGGSLKSFSAPTANLTGDFTVDGSLGALTLYDVIGHSTFHFAGAPPAGTNLAIATTMKFHNVTDAAINTATPVKSLTVNGWTDDPATAGDTITAPWIGSLTDKGNLPVGLVLSGLGAAAVTLGTTKITGGVSGAAWNITGAVGAVTISGAVTGWSLGDVGGALTNVKSLSLGAVSDSTITSAGAIGTVTAASWHGGSIDGVSLGTLTVKGDYTDSTLTLSRAFEAATPKVQALGKLAVTGTMSNVRVRTPGNIGAVSAGTMADSLVFAGLRGTLTELPSADSDFISLDTSLLPSIGSLTAKTFSNSVVSAWTINKTSLKTIATDNSANGDRHFGLAGHIVKPYIAPTTQDDFEVRLI